MFPTELFKKLRRGPQVIVLKDCAVVSAFTGLQSGDRVVDAGTGSGFLAIYLASIVAPAGKVFSYEWRPEFIELAEENVKKAGLSQVVEVKEKNVFEGIEEKEVDLVTLDLANAENALQHAFNALKNKGFCTGFSPNIEQAKKLVEEGKEIGFRHEKTVEASVREWLVREKEGCRPQTKGLFHTNFISFLRK